MKPKPYPIQTHPETFLLGQLDRPEVTVRPGVPRWLEHEPPTFFLLLIFLFLLVLLLSSYFFLYHPFSLSHQFSSFLPPSKLPNLLHFPSSLYINSLFIFFIFFFSLSHFLTHFSRSCMRRKCAWRLLSVVIRRSSYRLDYWSRLRLEVGDFSKFIFVNISLLSSNFTITLIHFSSYSHALF